jgi:hypothetical protein
MNATPTNNDQDTFQVLLMKAVDNELSAEEKVMFEQYISQHPDYRDEWIKYKRLKEVTRSMKFKSPTPEVWDSYWIGVYNRLERGIAWTLFSIGAVILITYGAFKFVEALIADPGLALIVKIGMVLVIGGLVLLLVSVLREKLFTHKRDPYKEVRR